MATIERVYTVPFKGAYNYKRTSRSIRASKILRAFLARHMKADAKNVKIDAKLNDYLWSHGMTRPPHKIKLRAKKGDDGIVFATLLEAEKPAAKPAATEKKAAAEKKPAPEAKKAEGAKQNAVKEVKAEKKSKPKE